MIEIMNILAFCFGLFTSWFVLRRLVNFVVMIILFTPYYSKTRFDDLYAMANDEATYKSLNSESIKTYADFLHLHTDVKKSAHKRFRRYFDSSLKTILLKIVPFVLLPSIIFWENWYWSIIGILFMVILVIIYKLFVEQLGVGFYQRAMIVTIFTNYLKDVK